MLKLADPPAEMRLVRWNKELPAASAQDPLGLMLRMSARLAAELLYCITSITPRARYYSFFPWAFRDYKNCEAGRSEDRGRLRGVRSRERAMVLGAVLHHDGSPCEGGALGGSTKAQAIAEAAGAKEIDLDQWQHLQEREGQFGAAYKASLINLGLFKTDEDQVNEEATESGSLGEAVQDIDVVELSARGERLAAAFGASVQSTRYVSEQMTSQSELAFDVLRDFGSVAGLCELTRPDAQDRAPLREIFFSCDRESRETAHYRRRMSLLLLLESVRVLGERGIRLDETQFSDLVYFGSVLNSESKSDYFNIELPVALRDISQRWRMFYVHGYLALALQSLLVCITRILRLHPGGIDRGRLLDEFDEAAIGEQFRAIFDQNLPAAFFELSPRQLLSIDDDAGDNAKATSPAINARFGERELARLLADEGKVGDAVGICLASILLCTVLRRYERMLGSNYDAWYQNHIQDSFADVSATNVLAYVREDSGDAWLDTKIRVILNRVNWRFVLLQHQTMSYERGFGGSAPLFHIDGTVIVGTQTDYLDPLPFNARFPSALQILKDLRLLTEDSEGYPTITDEGRAWLDQELHQKDSGAAQS